MDRQRVYSGAPWELTVGYCRATRVGNQIFVSGTTAMQDGQVVAPQDAGGQTRHILQTISDALVQLGSSFDDVVRCRIYVVDLSDTEKITKQLSTYLTPVHPAATLVGVPGLIDPGLLVEIEVDAVVSSASPVL